MAEGFKLAVERRQQRGSTECRRLRKRGVIPGNLYGHGLEPVAIAAPADAISSLVMHGHRVVGLEYDGSSETAMFQDVQWDALGIQIQHFDLLRVDAQERVEVEVLIELKGTSPGAMAGGMLEQPLHELTIECPAIQMPDSIVVRINDLQIGQAIHVRDLELPEGVTAVTDPDQVIVQVVQPVEVPEEAEEGLPGPAEPELVGRKPAEESEEG
ncbi:MAG TPA: 50S ribosomal protein L25 [Planctomycetaceae bacterium]|nr:50S ribosomal protein L25 [Planctomycetaceae bacterium]